MEKEKGFCPQTLKHIEQTKSLPIKSHYLEEWKAEAEIINRNIKVEPRPSFCNQIKQEGKLTPIAVEAVRVAGMEQNNAVMEEALRKIQKTTKEYMDAYSEPNSILREVTPSQLFVFLVRSIDKIIDDQKLQEALK